MDLKRGGRATALIVQIYGSSGFLSQIEKIRFFPNFFEFFEKLIVKPFSISRKFFHYVSYRLKCFLYNFCEPRDMIWTGGMICLNLKPVLTENKNLEMATSTDRNGACLAVFHEITRPISLRDFTDSNTLVTTYVRIPRDIFFIYTDQNPNILRKVELSHGVRIFHGRDFERGRDRDRPSAPRGTARFCIYGRYRYVMAAKREIFGWIEVQAEFKEEEVFVPESAAGSVIGRQGSRVAKMEVQSKARIDVQTRDDRNSEQQNTEGIKVVVSGRRPARMAARKLIQECVDHSDRMREKDKIRDSIRDVRRRIMYGNEDEDEEEEEPQPSRDEEEGEELQPPEPPIRTSLMFKPRSVQVAEARAEWKAGKKSDPKILTEWGGVKGPESSSLSEETGQSWGEGAATWADLTPNDECQSLNEVSAWGR